MDIDQAHRNGHIYRRTPLSWACTTHGQNLREKGLLLVAPCCSLVVQDEPLVSA